MSQQFARVYPKSHLGEKERVMIATSLRGRFQDLPEEKLLKKLAPGLDGSSPAQETIRGPATPFWSTRGNKLSAQGTNLRQHIPWWHMLLLKGEELRGLTSIRELKNSINAQLGVAGASLMADQQKATG